jgi:hypothetical protein
MRFHDEPRASDVTLPIYSVFKERPKMGTFNGVTIPISFVSFKQRKPGHKVKWGCRGVQLNAPTETFPTTGNIPNTPQKQMGADIPHRTPVPIFQTKRRRTTFYRSTPSIN